MDWDRSDTLEHCIICVSFIFCMNLILTLAFTRRIAVVCAFEIHFFFVVLTIREVLRIPWTNEVSLEFKAPITSAETR